MLKALKRYKSLTKPFVPSLVVSGKGNKTVLSRYITEFSDIGAKNNKFIDRIRTKEFMKAMTIPFHSRSVTPKIKGINHLEKKITGDFFRKLNKIHITAEEKIDMHKDPKDRGDSRNIKKIKSKKETVQKSVSN